MRQQNKIVFYIIGVLALVVIAGLALTYKSHTDLNSNTGESGNNKGQVVVDNSVNAQTLETADTKNNRFQNILENKRGYLDSVMFFCKLHPNLVRGIIIIIGGIILLPILYSYIVCPILANANLTNEKNGDTPLISATCNGDLATVQWLVNHAKADVNVQDKDGDTPLLYAAYNGKLNIVKWLVNKANVNPNQVNKNRDTPLICAAYNGKLNIVKWLVNQANADINAANNYGNTPLILASRNGHLHTVKWLVDEENKINLNDVTIFVNVNVQNKKGETALHWAINQGHTTVANFLKSKGAKNDIKEDQ